MERRGDAVREVLALAVIGLALCVMVYNEVRLIVPLSEHNIQTFIAYGHEVHFTVRDSEIGHIDLEKAWRPRILSNIAGALATRPAFGAKDPGAQLAHLIGVYSAVWLGITFLLYLWTLGRKALVPILGTFAAVAFGYMPGLGDRVYPWDLPGLCFFTLFACLLLKGKQNRFLYVLPVAVLFKETAGVLAVAYLFGAGARRGRLRLFSAAAALCLVTKVTADLLTHSMGRFTFDGSLLLANLRYMMDGTFPHPEWYPSLTGFSHPLLLDAGLLLAFILYPFRHRHAWMLRTIVGCFAAGTLFYGVVFEYRIWFELVPILLYPFLDPLVRRAGDDLAGAGAVADGGR